MAILVTTGHGHVRPRVDGFKARCGGPAICSECSREQSLKASLPQITKEDRLNAIAEVRSKDGGFSDQLSYGDRLKLRAIVKKVHMKHYPKSMITDYEADKMIDVIAPETWTFLIHRHLEAGR